MRAYICRLLLECSLRSNLTTVFFFLLYFFVFKPVQNNPVIILLHLMFDEVQLRLTLSLTDLRQCHQPGWIGSSQRGLRCDALIFSLTPAAAPPFFSFWWRYSYWSSIYKWMLWASLSSPASTTISCRLPLPQRSEQRRIKASAPFFLENIWSEFGGSDGAVMESF